MLYWMMLAGMWSLMPPPPDTTALARHMQAQGLVNVRTVDAGIAIDIKYSTTDNFMKADAYGSFAECYLQPEVARMLARANATLQKAHPNRRIVAFDCARPHSVQRRMWALVAGTPQAAYVASPEGAGSVHNYGCAVDVGIALADGSLLDMGTPYDFFGKLAEPRHEQALLAQGKLTKQHLANRQALRTAMKAAGFRSIPNEWWHFDALPKAEAAAKYRRVE